MEASCSGLLSVERRLAYSLLGRDRSQGQHSELASEQRGCCGRLVSSSRQTLRWIAVMCGGRVVGDWLKGMLIGKARRRQEERRTADVADMIVTVDSPGAQGRHVNRVRGQHAWAPIQLLICREGKVAKKKEVGGQCPAIKLRFGLS